MQRHFSTGSHLLVDLIRLHASHRDRPPATLPVARILARAGTRQTGRPATASAAIEADSACRRRAAGSGRHDGS